MNEKLYNELLLRYNELEIENKQLEQENMRLRQQFGLAEIPNENNGIPVIEAASVNKYSSSREKIDLFRSLFCGCEDVFAKWWQSTTSGKSFYLSAQICFIFPRYNYQQTRRIRSNVTIQEVLN